MKSGVFTWLLAALLLAWLPDNSQNLLYDGDFSLTTGIDNCYGYPPPGIWCEYIGYYLHPPFQHATMLSHTPVSYRMFVVIRVAETEP